MLRITEELRKILSEPHGVLYEGEGLEPIKNAICSTERTSILVCVGDIVSYYTLKADFKPDIVVIDGKSVRKTLNSNIASEIEEKTSKYRAIRAVNPAGHITEDLVENLFKAIELAVSGVRVKVFVDGEEDLAVMPLVVMLPKGSLIVYGQPKRGVVALAVDEEKKILISSLLERMEELGGGVLEKLRRWSDGDTS